MLLVFLTFLSWQLIGAFWLFDNYKGAYFTISILNSFSYSFLFLFYPKVHARRNSLLTNLFVVAVLMVGEWITQVGGITSPNVSLGLILGQAPGFIQHYRWIGIEGGTIWILLTNVFVYQILSKKPEVRYHLRYGLLITVLFLLPVFALFGHEANQRNSVLKVGVLNANIDHYSDFAIRNPDLMADSLMNLSAECLASKTDIIVWPEVIINPAGWLNQLDNEQAIQTIKEKLPAFSDTKVLLGAIAFSIANSSDRESKYTTRDVQNDLYYRTHNVALCISKDAHAKFRSKERFIPFQERIPFLNNLPFLDDWYGTHSMTSRFTHYEGNNQETFQVKDARVSSILCYESLFSGFMMSLLDCDAIVIHASEGWMKSKSGKEQYLSELYPLAIETGKPIIRSSNNGISCIIDEKGKTLAIAEGETKCLIQEIKIGSGNTFYASIAGSFHTISIVYVLGILTIGTIFKNK